MIETNLDRENWPQWTKGDWLPGLVGGSPTGLTALSSLGRDRTTFRVRVESGRRTVVKWFRGAGEAEKHHEILASVASTRISAPKPLGWKRLDSTEGSLVAMEDLPGLLWYSTAGPRTLDAARVQEAVSTLFAIGNLEAEGLKWREYPADYWPNAFLVDVEEYRRVLSGDGLPGLVAEAVDVLEATANSGYQAWDQIPDHGDYGPHNILFDGSLLTGVVDWDRACIWDRSVVLGIAVAEIYALETALRTREAIASQFLAEYSDAIGSNESEIKQRLFPHSLTRVIDWLCAGTGAPARIHEESLQSLMSWKETNAA